MTTSDDQLHGWAKKKPQSTLQSRTCTKKGHGHCLVVCAGLIPYSFLNPGETITSERHAQRLMTCTEHCNACSWHQPTERARLFSTTMPDGMSHNPCFKNRMNWVTKFCLNCRIHLTSCQLPTTSFKHLNNFLQGNNITTSRRQKMLSKDLWSPKAWIFMLQE